MSNKTFQLNTTISVIDSVKNNLGTDKERELFFKSQEKKQKPLILISDNDGESGLMKMVFPLKIEGETYLLKVLDPISNYYDEGLKWFNYYIENLKIIKDNCEGNLTGGWKLVTDEFSCLLINSKIQVVLYFSLALEALINSKLPEGEVIFKKKTFSRDEIERKFEIKDKISIILKEVKKGKTKIQSEIDFLISMYKIRNDLVHTKSVKKIVSKNGFIEHQHNAFKIDLGKIKKSYESFKKYLEA